MHHSLSGGPLVVLIERSGHSFSVTFVKKVGVSSEVQNFQSPSGSTVALTLGYFPGIGLGGSIQ